jgi:hypothetical protein
MENNVFTPESYQLGWDGPFDAEGVLIRKDVL